MGKETRTVADLSTGPEVGVEAQATPELNVGFSSPPPVQRVQRVDVISNLDHPVTLSYNGEGRLLSPRGKLRRLDRRLIGALPRGVSLTPSPNSQEQP